MPERRYVIAAVLLHLAVALGVLRLRKGLRSLLAELICQLQSVRTQIQKRSSPHPLLS